MNEPQQGRSSPPVPQKNAKASAPGNRVLVAQGLLMVGIVLLLAAAILVLAVRPFLSQNPKPAPEKPVAVVEKSEPAPVSIPAAQPLEPTAPAPVSVPVPVAEPSPVPVVAEPPPVPDSVAEESPAAVPLAAPDELPLLVTDAGPDAAIAEYVAKVEVLGYAPGQVLLRLPGQEEAQGFREGDVLDGAFPLKILLVTDRRVSFGDDRGHTYSRSY